ncbi:TlpA disulfide reductase family protein [Sphingomonas sp.]|uniref:TlpA family protein disulfide reductase n=1 Tax=Sphingomonas sp. TaxID=28214 RepID=UPI00286A12F1|nr:TlpA disulfide reductase family protein [Sphingomonas sp.]
MPVSPRLIVLLLIGLIAAGCDRQKAEAPQAQATNDAAPAAPAATGKGVDRNHKGEAAPTAMFKNPDDGDFNIAKFKGVPVLVNLWASWCAPCVKELPTLQKLEAAQGADGKLAVISVSQDSAPKGSVDAFLAEKNIGKFAAYRDPEMALTSALGVQIMPTTILYDAAGKEVWRFTGDLDWTGAEATKLLAEAQ